MNQESQAWITLLDDEDLCYLGRGNWNNDLKYAFRNAIDDLPGKGETTSTYSQQNSKVKKLVLNELRSLLCTKDKKYQDLRGSFASERQNLTTIAVPTVAVAVSEYVGISAGPLVGILAIALATIRKIGQNAFCEYMSEMEKEF